MLHGRGMGHFHTGICIIGEVGEMEALTDRELLEMEKTADVVAELIDRGYTLIDGEWD